MSLTTGIVRKLRRYSQWFWSSHVVCLRPAGLPDGVLVETLVSVTDMFVVSSSPFKGYLLRHYFWTTWRSFLPYATCNTTFKCQRLRSSSPTAKVCLCWPQPDKSDVYALLKELDDKVVKLPFPALGTGFKVPTQSRADYTGITSCFRWISQFALHHWPSFLRGCWRVLIWRRRVRVDLAGLKCRLRAIKHIGVVLPHDTSLSSMLTGLAEEHTVLESVFWPTRTRCISCRREVVLSCTQWVAHSSYSGTSR